jgi:3-phosphoshikimate 1-carboxyvinyltransferase
MPQPLISRTSGPLAGTLTPPGDKSMSHRAVMLGGIAEGVTTIRGLLEGEDVLHTVKTLKALGAEIVKKGNIWNIKGAGLNGLHASDSALDMGNSGTSARLLIGLLGARPFASAITGDASLCKRPMARVITPLEQMGAKFETQPGGRLPLTITGPAKPTPIAYRLPVASAQVKSAILLAGLSAEGTTIVIETRPTRDHTENMLRHFGANLTIKRTPDGEAISITGPARLKGQDLTIPADISSAAFPIVAALIRPSSEVTLNNVGINPRRAGLLQTLLEMNANIILSNRREICGEPVADIIVAASTLEGVTVPAERVPSMVDEYPALAMAAACAKGTTRLCGLGELRVKESDRLTLVADGLKACGARIKIEGDDLIIYGTGIPPQGGATIETAMDHRIAMSFLILGMATPSPISIDDGSFIATSFPGFSEMMNGLGARIG